MKKIAAAVAACFTLAGAAQAGNYGNFVVFGDSLSDAGTFGARFTTNPGTVWSQDVSSALGFRPGEAQIFNGAGYTLNPGGNIWAQGGARVNAVPGNGIPFAQPVSTQLDTYLATGGGVSGSTLYAFWGGANDVFYQATSGLPSPLIQANVATAAQDLATQMARLQAAGARYMVVMNLPNLGQTPLGRFSGPAGSAALTGLAQLYNGTLDAALDAAGVQALRLDTYRLLDEVLANPAAYGFAVGNAGVACTTPVALSCTPATLTTPTAASTYVFADDIHPTAAAHQVIADYVMSVLRAPNLVARAADRLSATGDSQWLGSDSRQRRFLDGLQGEGAADFYVTGQAVNARLGSQDELPGSNGHPDALRVGVDKNFGDGWFGGMSVAYVNDRFDLSGEAKGRGHGVSFSGYGSKRLGAAYVSAAVNLTSMDYDLKRQFNLGIASRDEQGTASGNVKGLRLETGYDLGQGAFRHGPLAALTYRHVWLGGYSEDSNRATALAYGDQKFDQLRTSLGYQASWQVGPNLRLSSRLTWENEGMDSRRDLSFGVAANNGRIAIPVGTDHGSYSQFNLGADWAIGKGSAVAATLNAAAAEHGSHQEALLVTYSASF